MHLFFIYSIVLLISQASQSNCLPADPNQPWIFNHPIYDPAPESLECNYQDDPPYVPLFCNHPDENQRDEEDMYLATHTEYSSVQTPNDMETSRDSDEGQGSSRNWDLLSQYLQRQQMTHEDFENSSERLPSLPINDVEEVDHQQRPSPNERKARRIFYNTARELGSTMWTQSLYKRYTEWIRPNLMEELLSDDDSIVRRATRSMLLHRHPYVSRYDETTVNDLPTGPIYESYTKEDIVQRLYEVMDISPVEDVKYYWYDRICDQACHQVCRNGVVDNDVFANLLSDDRSRQEAAIRDLTRLVPHQGLWIREKKRKEI